MGSPLNLDPKTLTVGELLAIHELTDLGTSEIFAAIANGSGAEHPGMIVALVLIDGVRREGPTFTLVDAGAVPYMSLIDGEDDGAET